MAAINQIKLNSTSTTYDVNDKRITTTAVTTATHFLATDSSVSSIAPITAANAASVLGVPSYAEVNLADYVDAAAVYQVLSNYEQAGAYSLCSGYTSAGSECVWYGMKHGQVGELLIWCRGGILCIQITNPNTITKAYSIVSFY